VLRALTMYKLPAVQDNECNFFTANSLLLLLGSSGSSLLSGLLGGGLGKRSLVEVKRRVLLSNGFDEVLLAEILDQSTSDGATNLELLAKDGSGDAEDLGDLLEHSLVLLLVKENSVVSLLLNLDLGP